MRVSSCNCNIGSSYCLDIYGCITVAMQINGAFVSPVNAIFEDHFGSAYKIENLVPVDGNVTIDMTEVPVLGLVNPNSENILLYFESLTGQPVAMTLDGESYDSLLLKFHRGTSQQTLIIQ